MKRLLPWELHKIPTGESDAIARTSDNTNEIAEIHNGSINVVVSPQMKFTFYMAIS
ncbi:hypothetical protein OAB70_01760 [bacterium]|nr:hypothetical protein [bacterium]